MDSDILALEDWQATAEALANKPCMQTWQEPYDAGHYLPAGIDG